MLNDLVNEILKNSWASIETPMKDEVELLGGSEMAMYCVFFKDGTKQIIIGERIKEKRNSIIILNGSKKVVAIINKGECLSVTRDGN